MLLLPASITVDEALGARRLLVKGLQDQGDAQAVLDAANLARFDTSALAVLLECRRAADTWGKPFRLLNPSASLTALAKLHGVDAFLGLDAAAAEPPADGIGMGGRPSR